MDGASANTAEYSEPDLIQIIFSFSLGCKLWNHF